MKINILMVGVMLGCASPHGSSRCAVELVVDSMMTDMHPLKGEEPGVLLYDMTIRNRSDSVLYLYTRPLAKHEIDSLGGICLHNLHAVYKGDIIKSIVTNFRLIVIFMRML